MRWAVLLVGLLNGAWMLIDGAYVLFNGKYIGPEKPGPWASLLSLAGVDVFKLGPAFILFGIAWLVFVGAFWMETSWARNLGLVLSVLTLWYLPVGTIISIVVFAGLMFFIKS
jgi:hypothetical protein